MPTANPLFFFVHTVRSTTSTTTTIHNNMAYTHQAPRTLAVRQLQMVGGGPRGRSGGGVNIEGADGATVVLASAMPVQGIQQRSLSVDADEYGESGAFVLYIRCVSRSSRNTDVRPLIIRNLEYIGTTSFACTPSHRFSCRISLLFWPHQSKRAGDNRRYVRVEAGHASTLNPDMASAHVESKLFGD